MARYFKLFRFYFVFGFPTLVVAYVVCATVVYIIFGRHWLAFFGFFRMPMYHALYPLQYLAIASVAYAAVASGWSTWRCGGSAGRRRTLETWCVLMLSFVFAATGFGMLFIYHDMAAGCFPEDWFLRILWGGIAGVPLGFLVYLQSVPSNIIMTVLMFGLTKRLDEFSRRIGAWEGRVYRNVNAVMSCLSVVGLAIAIMQLVGLVQWIVPFE